MAWQEFVQANGPPGAYQYFQTLEKDADERWWFAQTWRPVVVALEIAFFIVLAVLVLWPWWGSAPRWRYCLHLGLLPWLFILPHWLGYAPLVFTSCASFEEGLLYVYILHDIPRAPWTELDAVVFEHLPRPLVSWSPGPGPVMSISGRRGFGLLSALLWSACLGALPALPFAARGWAVFLRAWWHGRAVFPAGDARRRPLS